MADNAPRRRSSLASNKRMTLHLQRLADEHGVSPDVDDRPLHVQRRSYAPAVGSDHSGASTKPAIEEPVTTFTFTLTFLPLACPTTFLPRNWFFLHFIFESTCDSRHYTAKACDYLCQRHLRRHAGVGEFGEFGEL